MTTSQKIRETYDRGAGVLNLMDWEKNVDPHYKKNNFRPPLPAQAGDVLFTRWITYGNLYRGAKELTIQPGCAATVTDLAAYGCILIQGHGQFGLHPSEAVIMLRYGQFSSDEFFVSEPAALAGVTICNHSRWEPLVILKHFAPNHPDMPR